MRYFFILLLASYTMTGFGQDAMYAVCPLKNSEKVPAATVYNVGGDSLDLKTYIGDKPTVLVFYRGGWCPYCTRHLSALGEVKNEIDSMGFELIGITPDDYTRLDSSITRSGVMDYTLFSDKDINAINAFGIGWEVNAVLFEKYKTKYNLDLEWWNGTKNHVLPVPAVFIIKNGKIQLQYVNPDYSKRLAPDLLLSLLGSLSDD